MTITELQQEISLRGTYALKKAMECINDIPEHEKHWKIWEHLFHAECVISDILKEHNQQNQQS